MTGESAVLWVGEFGPDALKKELLRDSSDALQILAYAKFKNPKSRKNETDRAHAVLCCPQTAFQANSQILAHATALPSPVSDPGDTKSTSTSQSQPPVRSESSKTGIKINALLIGDASMVQLRVSTARSTRWGIQLPALKRVGKGFDYDPTQPLKILEAAGFHRSHLQRISEDKDLHSLFANSLQLAHWSRSEDLPIPKLPILHNHLDGYRYTLWIDRKNYGSPYPIQILIHSPNTHLHLSIALPQPRAYATERKPELFLAGNELQSVRFYLPTKAQWKKFEEESNPEGPKLPEHIQKLRQEAIQAAKNLSRR